MTRTAPAPLDADALALLQRRFDRERAGRKAAETLLTAKARELFDALTTARQSEQRLQLALWASGEGIWEWSAADDALGIERFEIAGREVPWPRQPLTNLLALVHELEVTESALLDGMDAMLPLFARLRAAGFSLALDDFGTGYSSLSYLRQLPFDKVKIDRSFVQDIARDARAARMLDSIVGLCHGLGMSTVAEGVETVEQFDALHAMGVQEFQGYLFARPVPVEDWLTRLA